MRNSIQQFVWDCTTSKIAEKALIQQKHNGGLTLCHYETKEL